MLEWCILGWSVGNVKITGHFYITVVTCLPSIFFTDVDASVTSFLMVTSLSWRYLMAWQTASFSIFGDCRETFLLSKVSAWMMVLVSISNAEYVQYLALEPGESYRPSPASVTLLSQYCSSIFSCMYQNITDRIIKSAYTNLFSMEELLIAGNIYNCWYT